MYVCAFVCLSVCMYVCRQAARTKGKVQFTRRESRPRADDAIIPASYPTVHYHTQSCRVWSHSAKPDIPVDALRYGDTTASMSVYVKLYGVAD